MGLKEWVGVMPAQKNSIDKKNTSNGCRHTWVAASLGGPHAWFLHHDDKIYIYIYNCCMQVYNHGVHIMHIL